VEGYYLLRGGAYTEKGRHDRAISDFTKAIELNPKFAEAYVFRAFVYSKKLSDYKKACPDWKRACELGSCEKYELAKIKAHCQAHLSPPSKSIDSKTSKTNLVRKVQQNLSRLGYNPGPADGIIGPKTRAAVKAFQRDNDLKIDSRINEALLEQLVSAGSSN
jgi:tetratricopeptide (TPR) repeat protein